MKEKWDERYASSEFAYGEAPNAYLQAHLSQFPVGTILFPAEGEGRNAVYAATLGWTAHAFDQSIQGQKKALQLADKHKVSISYEVGEPTGLPYRADQFDAMAFIYAHFPADRKSAYHRLLASYLKPGGVVLFEAFSKNHLAYVTRNAQVGGPKDPDMLFSVEEIASDFADFDVIELAEQEIELNEGVFHNGTGSVIRFIGRKR